MDLHGLFAGMPWATAATVHCRSQRPEAASWSAVTTVKTTYKEGLVFIQTTLSYGMPAPFTELKFQSHPLVQGLGMIAMPLLNGRYAVKGIPYADTLTVNGVWDGIKYWTETEWISVQGVPAA